MLKKIREVAFFKLFGLIAVYFAVSYVVYLLVKRFGHSDDLVIGLGIVSVVIAALLFAAIFIQRKKR